MREERTEETVEKRLAETKGKGREKEGRKGVKGGGGQERPGGDEERSGGPRGGGEQRSIDESRAQNRG